MILGCTHYPLLKPIISAKIGSSVQLINSAEEVVNHLKKELPVDKINGGKSKFFFSDLTKQVQIITQRWLGQDISLEEVNLS